MRADPSARDAFVGQVEAHHGILHKVARAYCWSSDDRDDHGHREIAAVLRLSETNVATKVHRIKQRLRRRLESLA